QIIKSFSVLIQYGPDGSSNSFDHLFINPSTPMALFTMVEMCSENFNLGSSLTPRSSTNVIISRELPQRVFPRSFPDLAIFHLTFALTLLYRNMTCVSNCSRRIISTREFVNTKADYRIGTISINMQWLPPPRPAALFIFCSHSLIRQYFVQRAALGDGAPHSRNTSFSVVCQTLTKEVVQSTIFSLSSSSFSSLFTNEDQLTENDHTTAKTAEKHGISQSVVIRVEKTRNVGPKQQSQGRPKALAGPKATPIMSQIFISIARYIDKRQKEMFKFDMTTGTCLLGLETRSMEWIVNMQSESWELAPRRSTYINVLDICINYPTLHIHATVIIDASVNVNVNDVTQAQNFAPFFLFRSQPDTTASASCGRSAVAVVFGNYETFLGQRSGSEVR
ncbi:Hypothetical predicted protein, partial [Drosophila guanche]